MLEARSKFGALARVGVRKVTQPIVRDSASIMIAQLCSKGIFYLVAVVVARYLSVHDFAVFNYFVVTSALLAGYFGLGLPLAVTKVLAPRTRDEATDDGVSAIIWWAGLSSAGALLGAPLFMRLLLPDELHLNGYWVVICAVVSIWATLGQTALYAIGRFAAALLPVLAGSIVLAAATVWSASASSIATLLAGMIGAGLVMAMFVIVLLVRDKIMVEGRRLRHPRAAALRSVLRISLPVMGISIVFVTLNWAVARSLLEHQQTNQEFNIFSLGMQWFALALFVPMAAGQAVFPRYVRMSADGTVGLRAVAIPSAGTAAAMLAALPVGMAATPIVNWVYGGGYGIEPIFIGAVFLLAAVAGAQTLLAYVLLAFEGASVWLWVNIAGLSLCLLVLAILPPTTALEALARTALFHVVLLAGAIFLTLRAHRRRQEEASARPPETAA